MFCSQGAKITLASHFDYEVSWGAEQLKSFLIIFRLLNLQKQYVLGHKIAFLCIARGNPRPHITWYKDGAEIFSHLYMHVSRRR
jgi:hypothetical protein